MKFYQPSEIPGDPEIFLTGVIELFANYPADIVERAVGVTTGIPGQFKFCPRLAEIKEFMDGLCPEPRTYALLPAGPPTVEPAKPNTTKTKRYSYGEFLDWAKENGRPWRPIGRSETRAPPMPKPPLAPPKSLDDEF
jgi:hypothetical protein